MDSDGDPHRHTPGDPYSVLHPYTFPAPTIPPEEQAWRPSKNAMKRRMKKLRQEAAAFELEQRPRELQKEDPGTPQVRQISPPEATAGSHGHPATPAPANTRDKQERRAMKKAKLKKLREAAAALKLEQGPSELHKEDPGRPQIRQISPPTALATGSPETPDTQHIGEQTKKKASRNRRQRVPALEPQDETPEFRPECPLYSRQLIQNKEEMIPEERRRQARRVTGSSAPAGARVRHSVLYSDCPSRSKSSTRSSAPAGARVHHSVLYSDRPSRSKSSTRVWEHVGEVSSRELEALTLDQSQPTPDSAHRSSAPAGARVRHSVLYSDRPSRSKSSTRVWEHVGEVSSRELEALTLDQSHPTPDSAHRAEKHESEVSNMELEARTMHQSPPTLDSTPSIEDYASEVRALKLARSPPTLDLTHRSMECAYDTTSSETGSGIAEKPKNKSVPWAKRHLYIDIVEALIAHEHGYSNPAQHKLDAEAYWAAGEKVEAPKVSESLASRTEKLAQGKASREEIVENGNKWMGEEVMVAFEKYIEGKKRFEDVLYCLDKLHYQCFSVESYNHIFHHFNFSVKTKKNSDADWSSALYFAEVKELYGRKYYSCYELDSYDDGHCYACKNQGMQALQHPICEIGYEGGHAAMGPAFVYFNDDDYFD